MNFNFIPTDNLYKFMSLCGLLIIVFNLYYSGEEVTKLEEEKIRFGEQARGHSEKLADLKSNLVAHIKSIETIREMYRKSTRQSDQGTKQLELLEAKGKTPSLHLLNAFKDSIARYDFMIDSLKKIERIINKQTRILEHEVDSIELIVNFNGKLLDLKARKVSFFSNLLWYLSFAGILMSTIGFVKWYELQQRMDQIIFKRTPPQRLGYGKKRLLRKTNKK